MITLEGCNGTIMEQLSANLRIHVSWIFCASVRDKKKSFLTATKDIRMLLHDPYSEIFFLIPASYFVPLFHILYYELQGKSIFTHGISLRILSHIKDLSIYRYHYNVINIDLVALTENIDVTFKHVALSSSSNNDSRNGYLAKARITYKRKVTRNDTRTHDDHKKHRHVRVTTVLHFAPSILLVPFALKSNRCMSAFHCRIPIMSNHNVVEWNESCCDGYVLKIFDAISKEVGFTYDLYITPDGYFGSFMNGTWNGMIKQVVEGKADVAIHSISVTAKRATAVEFTTGFDVSTMVIITKAKFKTLGFINWEFLKPLESSVVYGIIITTVVSMFAISLTENIRYFIWSKQHFSLREVMTYIFGLTFQRDMGGRNPIRWSGRIAALAYAAGMTIVMTTYTAHIAATNIRIKVHNDFKGLKDHRVSRH